MSQLLTGFAALVPLVALGLSGLAKIRNTSGFVNLIGAHGIVPENRATVVGVAVIAIELGLAVGGTTIVLSPGPRSLDTLVLVCGALVLGSFAVYSALVLRYQPATPCGCFGIDTRTTWLVPARAALLALLSIIGASTWAGAPSGLTNALILCEVALAASLLTFTVPTALRGEA